VFGTKAPTGVVLVALFIWVTGVVGMVRIGIALWHGVSNPDYIAALGGVGVFFAALAIAFFVNLIILSLSTALTNGSNVARILISISIVIHAILSVLSIFSAQGDTTTLVASWIALIINVLAFGALWIVSGGYFRKSSVTA
jgi:hypothetical protein